MAAAKKTAAAEAAETKAEASKETVVKRSPGRPKKNAVETSAKKEADTKTQDKKDADKKSAGRKASNKSAALEGTLCIQYGGKSYSQEDLLKIAKDVWVFDLNQEADDLGSVELYVKPEENVVYYVMNKKFTGSFQI